MFACCLAQIKQSTSLLVVSYFSNLKGQVSIFIIINNLYYNAVFSLVTNTALWIDVLHNRDSCQSTEKELCHLTHSWMLNKVFVLKAPQAVWTRKQWGMSILANSLESGVCACMHAFIIIISHHLAFSCQIRFHTWCCANIESCTHTHTHTGASEAK